MWLLYDNSRMSRGEPNLDRAENDSERGDQNEIDRRCDHQQDDLIRDQFDEEFWIKVKDLKYVLKCKFLDLFCNSLMQNVSHIKTFQSTKLFSSVKVHEKQNKGLSWNRAMDEVHVERLIQKYKDGGELDGEDPALLMLKQWPGSEKYKDDSDKLRALEQRVGTQGFDM